LFAANTTASQAAGGLYLYETHPTTPGDYSAWSTPVQITGSAITNNLGNSPAVVKVGSTYHLFYDLPSAGGIRHVTSTSLTSGFNTAGTYPSFPSATEGPAIITLANGTYRLYAEQNYQQSTAGLKYSDSTDLVTWGSVQSAVTQGYMGHPHGIQVTSQELLNKVSMLEQGQKNPVWSSLYDGKTAVAIGYPDINTESAFGPYGEGLTIFGGASGGSFLYVSTRNQNGAAIFTDPNASSPAGNNFYIARRSGLNYMRFDGGTNNVSFYGTATFLGSTSGSATISVSATGGLLALPSGTTATNMALTTPDLGTPSAIVLTNATGSPTGISLTMAQLNSIVSDGDPAYVGAANTFTTGQTISSTTSLLLGTAGSAVGNIGFRNATSGTTTLAPATGALGTGTVTLPLSGTLATLDGTETFTNKSIVATQLTGTIADARNTVSNSTTTTMSALGTIGGLTTVTGTGAMSFTGGAGNMTITSGTGNSRTLTLQTTTSGGTATNALTISATQAVSLPANVAATSTTTGTLVVTGGIGASAGIYGNFVYATTDVLCGATGKFKFGDTSSRMSSATNGIIVMTNASDTTFTRLAFGGATSGFPALTISGTGITAGLGDGTAGGSFTASGTLAVTGASTLTGLLTANGGITLGDAQNIAFNTTTGTKIGAATTQKLSFWNATPIVQPTTAVSSATFASPGAGTNIKTDDTFDGYTIAQVVKALRNAGLLA
jgi:hypothetical protein